MNLILKIFSIIIPTFMLILMLTKNIINKKFNIMHISYILFYIVQVIPVLYYMIFGVDEDIKRYGLTYEAMLNIKTDTIYSIFLIVISILYYYLAKSITKTFKVNSINQIKEKLKTSFLLKNIHCKWIYFFGMFITIPFIIFSPNISVYTHFAYFYMPKANWISAEYIYHTSIMSKVNLIAFICTLLFYLSNNKKDNNIFVIISAILITWINQKRTLIVFLMLGIIFIDFFLKEKKMKKTVLKAIIFFIIEVVYFIVYRYLTNKGANHTVNWLYTFYFSRLANVKVSIYDLFVEHKMLNYIGQSFVYDLLWFVPRKLWSAKPYPYDNYYTAFVFGKKIFEVPWDFQVNIWCEFFSNFGYLGPIIAILFIYQLVKNIEKSTNIITYAAGSMFIIIYTIFGCTGMALYLLTLYIISCVFNKFKIKKYR